jgi:hypothetical protein
MSDIKRYEYTPYGMKEHAEGWYVNYEDHAAEAARLKSELSDAKAESAQFETAYRDLFNRRAKSVTDLQQAVWKDLDRRSCPGAWLTRVADAILENGCAEIADTKKQIEDAKADSDALRRDAERYRWLRDECKKYNGFTIAKVTTWSLEPWSGDNPDARIDAAMAATGSEV